MTFDVLEAIQTYVRYPSISTDPAYKEGMAAARQFIATLLAKLDFRVKLIPTSLHPVFLARRDGARSHPHVIIYGHYDVQPPDPIEAWTTPPFEPHLRNGRLYGRGTADNKGPLMAYIAAVARIAEQDPAALPTITFLIEGEEEIGSPSFTDFLHTHKERLGGDLILLSDTSSPDPDHIVVTTALRGLTGAQVEVTGPRIDLHSGLHGGAVRNPIQALSKICASLHHDDGTVNLPGFYDDVVPVQDWEREAVARLPQSLEVYQRFLGVTDCVSPPGFSPLEAIRFAPTLEFNGIGGGYQGDGTKTIIPCKAQAKITCRLVPDQCPDTIQRCLIETIHNRCPKGVTVHCTPTPGSASYLVVPPGRPNTPPDQSPLLAEAFKATETAITAAFGTPPLFLRGGGSVPVIADFKRVLGLDSVMIGLFTPADNLHAPDESLHLGLLEKGIHAIVQILTHLTKAP